MVAALWQHAVKKGESEDGIKEARRRRRMRGMRRRNVEAFTA
jgi:hypothetical protein